MKTHLRPIACAAALAAALSLPATFASAADGPADSASQMLAVSGVVPVKDAGPYVHLGSYRIQVWTMLGRPTAVLPDGTYLYKDFAAQASAAHGTLVVRFDHGRADQLSLVSPEVALAMLNPVAPKQLITQR